MSKKIEVLTPIIMKLIHEGHSYSEIAEDLGLKNEKVIRNLVYRINHPKENSLPKKRGRKPKENLRDYNDEIKRLKMENQLLRDSVLHPLYNLDVLPQEVLRQPQYPDCHYILHSSASI